MTGQTKNNQLTTHAQEVLGRIGYPNALPSELTNANIIETHISVLLIGTDYVLKLKKCVAFPFVDHTAISQRWKSAVNEVVLNRRLSDEIYLGVIPIFSNQSFSIADCIDVTAESPVLEGLAEVGVLMKTIDQATVLATLIAQDQVSLKKHIIPLANRIAGFHKTQLSTSKPKITANTYYQQLAQLTRDNIALLQEHAANHLTTTQQILIKNISSYTEAFLTDNQQMLKERLASGLVIDGHGDLRAEHVCYRPKNVSIIDCIEFNDEIRQVDILNDIAFLRMDLDYLRQGLLANSLIATYHQQIGDIASNTALLDFYCCYRAMVRAKVQLLRVIELQTSENATFEEQLANEQQKIGSYISLAHRYTLPFPSPCLIAIGGLMGVGKSTLAEWTAEHTHATVLSSDVIRKQLYGRDQGDKHLNFGAQKYSKEATEKTYQQLFLHAAQTLAKGNSVIVDSSFIKQHHRRQVVETAKQAGVALLFIWCQLDEQQQRQRLEERNRKANSISDGRAELAALQRADFEKFSDDEVSNLLMFDTSKMPDATIIEAICKELQ